MKNQFQLTCNFDAAGDQPQAIAALVNGLQKGFNKQTLLGVTGSGKTFTMANVIATVQRPTLILAPNKTLAAQLYGEMREFFPKNAVEYFVSYYDYYQPEAYMPASDTFIEKDAAINEHIEQMRLSATKAILERRDTIIVASVSSIYGLGDPQLYLKMIVHLSRGAAIEREQLLMQLANLQYARNDCGLLRGEFRVRGDTIDIMPAESDWYALRVELFDDKIESIRYFDPLDGKLLEFTPRVTIYPKTHYATPRARIISAIAAIKCELDSQLIILRAQNKLAEAQRLQQRTLFDLEMLHEIGYCSGIENYSRFLSQRISGQPPPTLHDYLPQDALLIIDESHVTIPQLNAMYRGDKSRKDNLVNYGFRLPSALDNRPLRFDEFEKISPQTIYISATPGNYELQHSMAIVEQLVRPTGLIDPAIEVRNVDSQVENVLGEIRLRILKNERILITTLTKKMAEDLTKYLQEQEVRVRYLHSDINTVERVEIIRDLRLGEFDVLVGINLLREGLDIPEVSLVAIFDADKEGFLRGQTALTQTIGRAARNINGKAILYAAKITHSMQNAINETTRRRNKQIAFNRQNGINPQSIIKKIPDIMEGAQIAIKAKKSARAQIVNVKINNLAEAQSMIKQLEKKMLQHANDLEFEQAAQLRDQIKDIKKNIFLLND